MRPWEKTLWHGIEGGGDVCDSSRVLIYSLDFKLRLKSAAFILSLDGGSRFDRLLSVRGVVDVFLQVSSRAPVMLYFVLLFVVTL